MEPKLPKFPKFSKKKLPLNDTIKVELSEAIKRRDIESVHNLLVTAKENGLSVNGYDASFRAAIEYGYKDIVKLFLQHGISPDSYSALYLATYFRHEAIVKLLLKFGANPNGIGNPLSTAIERGYRGIIGRLLWAGADPSVDNNRAFHSALLFGPRDLVEFFQKEGLNQGGDNNYAFRLHFPDPTPDLSAPMPPAVFSIEHNKKPKDKANANVIPTAEQYQRVMLATNFMGRPNLNKQFLNTNEISQVANVCATVNQRKANPTLFKEKRLSMEEKHGKSRSESRSDRSSHSPR